MSKPVNLITALLEALDTDGEHHKQYWLEEALRLVVTTEDFDDLKKQMQWEEGKPQ